MTAVPQRTALSHAFGALAAALVGIGGLLSSQHVATRSTGFTMGALVARGDPRLPDLHRQPDGVRQAQEIIPTRPITYNSQNVDQPRRCSASAILAGVLLVFDPGQLAAVPDHLILLALAFGVLLIIPIGGADMPTVIALLELLRRPVGRARWASC